MIRWTMAQAAATDTGVEAAPRARRALAGLIDSAAISLPTALYRRGAGRGGKAGRSRELPSWTRELPRALASLGEQVGTPGGWIVGVRTVDRRTGRRIALWRTLVLLGVDLGGQLLVRRVSRPAITPEQQRQRETFLDDLAAIQQRHPDDPSAREAERRLLLARQAGPINAQLWRAAGPAIAIGVLKRRLRRRLAPTVVVRSRAR